MMKTIVNGLLFLVAASCGIAPSAQELPEGEHHGTRERTYDIRHYMAELRIDLTRRSLRGKATIELEPLEALELISLDAIGLKVSRVMLDGKAVEFKSLHKRLDISLPETRARGDRLTLQITYTAQPRSGMYFQRDTSNPLQQFVSTYGEGGLHANWLPIYGGPNDKFTTEMRVTVPAPYTVISNGVLLEQTESGKEITYHYKQERPHSNYLISLYIGCFERGELKPAFGETPLAYWVPEGRLAEGAYAFRNTTRMVEYFSERFDYRYPWVKYDQIAVPDYAIGAMEHTGVTGHNASVLRIEGQAPNDFGGPTFDEYHTDWTADATIAHELAHHWFGDNLTCRNLAHLWLNESFASYMMMLWVEESQGTDQLLMDVELARRHYLNYVEDEHEIRPLEYAYFDALDDIYNEEHTYLKGAAVLHMLRGVLGDEAFFGAMSHFLHKHEFDNVESNDLLVAIEEKTGQKLDWFFGDWITGGGHPIFEVEYRFLANRNKIDLSIAQVQARVEGQGGFRLPVVVSIVTPQRSWNETVWVDDDEDSFLISAQAEPLMVSIDGAGSLVAEIRFDKPADELIYQATHDELPGRMRALGQLAERFPVREATVKVFGEILGDEAAFWGLRAEAALLLGQLRTAEAGQLAAEALKSSDYRIRKAVVLGLTHFGTPDVAKALRQTIAEDAHPDVVGAAIVALARANPDVESELLLKQLERSSWYDEIRIATLEAMGELERQEFLPALRAQAKGQNNQGVRQAALEAWIATAPDDHALHQELIAVARSPVYSLQKFAIEQLGELYVFRAGPWLEELVKQDVDVDLTVLAREALEEITRITGRK